MFYASGYWTTVAVRAEEKTGVVVAVVCIRVVVEVWGDKRRRRRMMMGK